MKKLSIVCGHDVLHEIKYRDFIVEYHVYGFNSVTVILYPISYLTFPRFGCRREKRLQMLSAHHYLSLLVFIAKVYVEFRCSMDLTILLIL